MEWGRIEILREMTGPDQSTSLIHMYWIEFSGPVQSLIHYPTLQLLTCTNLSLTIIIPVYLELSEWSEWLSCDYNLENETEAGMAHG